MELILTLLFEFVVAPILSFCVQVFQFLVWMVCWVVVGVFRSAIAAARGIRSILTSDAGGST